MKTLATIAIALASIAGCQPPVKRPTEPQTKEETQAYQSFVGEKIASIEIGYRNRAIVIKCESGKRLAVVPSHPDYSMIRIFLWTEPFADPVKDER